MQITMRLAGRLPSLRTQVVFDVFKRSLRHACKDELRIIHFSLQRNHIHFIVEAPNAQRLGRGMGGLASGFARKLNGLLGRRGRVFIDRYHRRDLTSPRAVRSSLVYVLQNGIKHGVTRHLDTYSSAPFFDGGSSDAQPARLRLRSALTLAGLEPYDTARAPPPVVAPAVWLLRIAWKRHGLISARERPRV